MPPRSKSSSFNFEVIIPVFKLRGENRKIGYVTKTLGLTVDNSFSFKKHAEKITVRCKCWRKEKRILFTEKQGLSRNTLVFLYKTLILPTLLYCAPVWAIRDTKMIENSKLFVYCDILETRYSLNSMATEVYWNNFKRHRCSELLSQISNECSTIS